MAKKQLGPRQAAKKGNEHFEGQEETTGRVSFVKPEDAGRDTSDEESGAAGILRKADGEGPVLRDNGSDEERDREYGAPSDDR